MSTLTIPSGQSTPDVLSSSPVQRLQAQSPTSPLGSRSPSPVLYGTAPLIEQTLPEAADAEAAYKPQTDYFSITGVGRGRDPTPSGLSRTALSAPYPDIVQPSPFASDDEEEHAADQKYLSTQRTRPSRSPSSVSGSWGISGIGRGFDSSWSVEGTSDPSEEDDEFMSDALRLERNTHLNSVTNYRQEVDPIRSERRPSFPSSPSTEFLRAALDHIPFTPSPQPSPYLGSSPGRASTLPTFSPGMPSPRPLASRSNSAMSMSSVRSTRRRESQQRISLVAGRVMPVAPFTHPPHVGPNRWPSSTSVPHVSPRTPGGTLKEELEGVDIHRVDSFVLEGDAGHGAYGLVKRCRERKPDGSLGPLLIMKQVIKSRILADCWKKHPSHGTIPIEIYVMSALSSSAYVLPARRPWDPLRFAHDAQTVATAQADDEVASTPSSPSSKNSSRASTSTSLTSSGSSTEAPSSGTISAGSPITLPSPAISIHSHADIISGDSSKWVWREGAIYKGHPSIIPLLEFFEDAHYYYLILPAGRASFPPPPFPLDPSLQESIDADFHGKPPSDLFDLVERFPMGLPPPLIRGFLGQIADALAFLHARGICHRDIKDENVVLAEDGRCWLIDFGSSGVVRKQGWDTFSGTLDYAGPEILQGERYMGPPQDIWAFGIVAYVLVVGECPFSSAAEAAIGLVPGSKALNALEERCGRSPGSAPPPTPKPAFSPSSLFDFMTFDDVPGANLGEKKEDLSLEEDEALQRHKAEEGLEADGGGRMGDAMALIKACLQLDVNRRPAFEDIMGSRYLSGLDGWVELADPTEDGKEALDELIKQGTSPVTPTAILISSPAK